MRRLALLLLLAGCASDTDRLVGTWELAEAPADGRRYSFFADGTARIVVPAADGEPLAVSARYTLADSVLTLADVQGSERFVIRLAADTLVLRVPEAATSQTLVRARPASGAR